MLFSIRLLVDGFQEERIFGESLHGFDQDVHQSKAVAVALRLAPLNEPKKSHVKQTASKVFFSENNLPLNRLWKVRYRGLSLCSIAGIGSGPGSIWCMGGTIRQTAKTRLSIFSLENCFTATVPHTSQNELAMAHVLPLGIRLEGKWDRAGLWHCVRSWAWGIRARPKIACSQHKSLAN